MSNSSLVDYTKLSPYCSKPRSGKIKKITIHHMAGNLSVETCGNVFQSSRSSANYGVGTDGRVGLYVEEENRAWTSSNANNDNQAVTIEVANDGGAPDWHVSDTALEKTIQLCVDICKRNGIKELKFTGDKTGNLTMHKYFVATACPGPYLESKFPYIAAEVNKRLGAGGPTVEEKPTASPDPAPEAKKNTYTVELPQLSKGSEGESVRTLQVLLLHRWGHDPNGIDGIFGAGTRAAVIKFQKAHGLDADGIVGPATWAALLRG